MPQLESPVAHFGLDPDGSAFCRCWADGPGTVLPHRMRAGDIATLIDTTMMYRLRLAGVAGCTVSLSIRYHHPVFSGKPVVIRAWLVKQEPPLYTLRGELRQMDETPVIAEGLFWATDGCGNQS